MTITFAPYQLNSGSFALRRQPRLRLSDQQDVFALRRQPRLAMTGTAVTHVAMLLQQPAPRLRMSDRQNVFVLHHQPELAMSGSTPLPSASVFMLSQPGHTLAMTTTITTHATMALHRQPKLLMTGAPARFVLRRSPRLYLSDGHVDLDRTAFLLQQPELYASMAVGMTVGLADQFTGRDSHEADFIHALLDLMRLSDSYNRMAEVLQALADGISLADVAQMIWQADLLDQFIASGVLAGTAQITVLLADTFDAGDSTTAISEILAAIADGFYVTLTINTGDDIYTAWVMTPETKAMRSYTNFPFNSYATLGGQFLGAGPGGIYRMGGSTDDGVAIRAAIRTGLLNFGSQNMKSVSRAYIGATTTGNLLLRVQATTFKGEQVEQTYRMVPANTTDARAHRVDIGKGFRSVYWTFELANDTSGADFEVNDWHVLPVTLSGRLI